MGQREVVARMPYMPVVIQQDAGALRKLSIVGQTIPSSVLPASASALLCISTAPTLMPAAL